MGQIFTNLDGLEIVFLICGGIGAVFVLMRLILMFFGTDADTNSDFDVDAHHMDSDVSFKLVSLHGLTSFLLMFGLVGFAFYRQSQAGAILSLAGGILAGLASVWIIGKVFKMIVSLQSSGSVDAVSAIGSTGTVYLTIPKNGTGRVTVNFKNRLREFDASSQKNETIKTGEKIKVVWTEGNTLIVEKIAEK